MTATSDDEAAISLLLITYARACDERNWDLFDEIFTPDLVSESGGHRFEGRKARVDSIRSNLGGCGPTQHLLGNQRINVDGDEATSSTYVRALHVGAGERSQLTYEICGTYHDHLRRTSAGWRIYRRAMDVNIKLGAAEVLQPE